MANPALLWNWKKHNGRVLGMFIFDKNFLAREDFSDNRFAFFLETLKDLPRAQFRESGGDLLVLDTGPDEGFKKLFAKLNASLPLKRSPLDAQLPNPAPSATRGSRNSSKPGLELTSIRNATICSSNLTKSPRKGPSPFYQVYTPFQKS